MVDKAPQVRTMSTAETVNVAIDASGKLDSGETYTGTPTITEVSTSNLTLSNKAVNTGALTINGNSTAIGQAIQFTVSASTTGTYLVNWVCGTSASQTRDGRLTIVVC